MKGEGAKGKTEEDDEGEVLVRQEIVLQRVKKEQGHVDTTNQPTNENQERHEPTSNQRNASKRTTHTDIRTHTHTLKQTY